MDPIIKTARISPTSFSLNRRQPGGGPRQEQEKPKSELKMDWQKPAPKAQPSPAPAATPPMTEAILTDAAVGKLVPKPATQAPTEASSNEDRDRLKQKRELEEAHEKAKQEGYQAGLEAGRASARKDLDQAISQIRDLLHSLKDLDEALFQEMEDSAAEVIFAAVTKIIGQAALDKKIAYAITREAIEQVKGRERLVVRVSSKDYEMVRAALDDQDSAGLPVKSVSVVADNLVQLGGCLIETEAGSLDARLEIQLQRLKETLLGVRRSNDDA